MSSAGQTAPSWNEARHLVLLALVKMPTTAPSETPLGVGTVGPYSLSCRRPHGCQRSIIALSAEDALAEGMSSAEVQRS